jgi:hypothetical protein
MNINDLNSHTMERTWVRGELTSIDDEAINILILNIVTITITTLYTIHYRTILHFLSKSRCARVVDVVLLVVFLASGSTPSVYCGFPTHPPHGWLQVWKHHGGLFRASSTRVATSMEAPLSD